MVMRNNSSPARTSPRQEPRSRPALGVVDRRHALERARRRQARLLVLLAAAVVAAGLTIAAFGHAMLAATQVRADTLAAQLNKALAVQQNLELEKANLETPTRILSIAEHRLKMVAPSGVSYLEPVSTGPTVLQVEKAQGATSSQHRAK